MFKRIQKIRKYVSAGLIIIDVALWALKKYREAKAKKKLSGE